jgi:hypothetical protein
VALAILGDELVILVGQLAVSSVANSHGGSPFSASPTC